MLANSTLRDIQSRYNTGERDFAQLQLRRIDLRGVNLQGINLEGSDLSYADLRSANFSNANLSKCYFNESNLTGANFKGANLKGAYLIKAYLAKTNFSDAILQEAYLTGSFLTKANFSKADLSGALLTGIQIGGVYWKGAIYSTTTRFDQGFNPDAMGLEKISSFNIVGARKITIEDLVNNFQEIANLVSNYLGPSITTKYLDSSRPNVDWLNNFVIERARIKFNGLSSTKLTSMQVKWLEKWQIAFIRTCSYIVQDLPDLIQEKKLGIEYIKSV